MQVKTRFGSQILFCSTLLLTACGGGGGGGGGGPGTEEIPLPPAGSAYYTYVATKVNGPDTIRIYTGDINRGELRTVGSMAAGGDNPVGVAVARNAFVYVANNGIEPVADNPTTPANEFVPGNPGSVSAYRIDTATGNLTLIGNVTGVNYPASVTIAPNGNFVYVPNFEGQSVSVFRIEANGALTSVGNASTNFGGPINGVGPAQVAFTPNGQFAYSANKQSGNASGQGTVTVFSVAADGRLTPIQNIAAGVDPISLAVDPQGRSLYVANNVLPDDPATPTVVESRNGTVTMLTIGADGRLGAGTQYTAASLPQYVLVDPNGSAVYVANSGSNSISVFNRDATTGALTPRTALSVATSPWGMGLTPNGRFMYVANAGVDDGGISAFALGAAGSSPRALAYTPAPSANAVASTGVLP